MSLQQPHESSQSHLIVGFIMHDAASNCVKGRARDSVGLHTAEAELMDEDIGASACTSPHPVEEFNFRRAVIWLGSIGIDINEHAMNRAEAFDPARTGLDHLAFSVSSYDALVAWAAYLDVKGVAHSSIRHVKGVGEVVDFRDPDGIQIELWRRDHAGSWARYVKQKLDQFPSSPG